MNLSLQPGDIFAGYRVRARLGQGGMGAVYLAWDPKLERTVALKILSQVGEDASFRRRFMRESKLAASIGHPNVIPVFEAGEAEGVLYLTMQYVDGIDLKALLEREGRLDSGRTLSILGQVAKALDAAARKGLVHRDVKPANIMIVARAEPESEDQVYLLDFGLTKQSGSDTGLTRTGQFLGTLDYVAPEQIEGKTVDGRADAYALGCVLHECLTGNRPYQKDHEAALIYAHLSELAPPVTGARPDLPPAIDQVVAKAMSKSPEERYPSAGALIATARIALRGATSTGGTQVSPSVEETRAVESPAEPASPLANTLSVSKGLAYRNTEGDAFPVQSTATLPITHRRGGAEPTTMPLSTQPTEAGRHLAAPSLTKVRAWGGLVQRHSVGQPGTKRRAPHILIVLLVLALLVPVAAISAITAVKLQGETTTVANVVGTDRSPAVHRLDSSNLRPQSSDEASCAVASGKVIRTEPAPGSRVRPGSAVHLFVSTGPDVTVPNLAGIDATAAEDTLKRVHIRFVTTTEDSNDVPAGWVIRAEPGRDARVCSGSVVRLVLSRDIPFRVSTDVVRAYIQAINRKDYGSAYSLFGPGLRSRQTIEEFRAGFADTTSDQVLELSNRGPVSTGSTVYIRFVAHRVDGSTRTFSGTYQVGQIGSRWALLGANVSQQ